MRYDIIVLIESQMANGFSFQFGIFGVFCIATLTDYCCQLLIRCKHIVIEALCDEAVESRDIELHEVPALRRRLHRSVGYGDLGKRAFGPWCYQFIQFLVWFTQLATCVSYFIFLGNTTHSLWPLVAPNVTDTVETPNYVLESAMSQGIPMLHIENIGHPNIALHSVNHDTSLSLSARHQAKCGIHELIHDVRANERSVEENFTFAPLSFSTESPTSTTPNTPIGESTAPNLILVMLFPLAFFIVTSLIRKMRTIAPFSFIATVFLAVGAGLVLVKLSIGKFGEDVCHLYIVCIIFDIHAIKT